MKMAIQNRKLWEVDSEFLQKTASKNRQKPIHRYYDGYIIKMD